MGVLERSKHPIFWKTGAGTQPPGAQQLEPTARS